MFVKQFRISEANQRVVMENIQEKLERGIIEHS